MEIRKISKTVVAFFEAEQGRTGKVIAVQETDEGWLVEIEITEEDEYMRQRARRDILAIYEVRMDKAFNIKGYARKAMRERTELLEAE